MDITCGEMAVSRNLLQAKSSEWALTNRHVTEDIFGVQICGSWPDELTKVAELLDTFLDVDFIDINCGCPIDLICNHGSGCRLAKTADRLAFSVEGRQPFHFLWTGPLFSVTPVFSFTLPVFTFQFSHFQLLHPL